jgi:hypothetical protein
MINVLYLNSNLFQNVAHTPLISVDQSINYTNRFLSGYKKITLRGRLIRNPKCGTWKQYNDVQNVLLERLKTNFGELKVFEKEDVSGIERTVFKCDRAIFRNISFDESAYYNMVPFTIEFDCYDDFLVSTGVTNASDEISYSENDNRTISITRNIRATAVNAGPTGTAIEYAKAFVENRINSSFNFPANGPRFANVTSTNTVLVSVEKSVNKLSGEYSASLTFLCDPKNSSNSDKAVLAYVVEIGEVKNELTVTINGTMTGGLTSKLSDFRNVFAGINWHSKAQSYVTETLSTSPRGINITEDSTANTINFNVSYSNNLNNGVYVIDNTTVSNDFNTNVKCISVKIDIKCDYDCIETRWNNIKSYYDTFNLDTYIANKWAKYLPSEKYGKTAKSKSISFNEQTATISISQQNCTDNSEDCGCLEEFQYSISSNPAITMYSETPALEGKGCYYIQNLKYDRRAKFTISGNFRPSKCCTIEESISELKSRINFYCTYYFVADNKVLEESNITYTENKGNISFTFSWSGNQDNYIPEHLK